MSLRPLLLVAWLVAITLVPGAAAQFVITVEPPTAAPTVDVGGSTDAQFNVKMGTAPNAQFVCAQQTALTVTLTPTKTDPAQGLNATVMPATITFNIPAGPHVGGATTAWEGSQSATLTASVAAGSSFDHDQHVFGVLAEYSATPPPANCQGAGGFADASDEGDIPVNVNFPPGSRGNATGSPSPTNGDTNDSPAPAALVPALLLVAYLATRRRR